MVYKTRPSWSKGKDNGELSATRKQGGQHRLLRRGRKGPPLPERGDEKARPEP